MSWEDWVEFTPNLNPVWQIKDLNISSDILIPFDIISSIAKMDWMTAIKLRRLDHMHNVVFSEFKFDIYIRGIKYTVPVKHIRYLCEDWKNDQPYIRAFYINKETFYYRRWYLTGVLWLDKTENSEKEYSYKGILRKDTNRFRTIKYYSNGRVQSLHRFNSKHFYHSKGPVHHEFLEYPDGSEETIEHGYPIKSIINGNEIIHPSDHWLFLPKGTTMADIFVHL